MSKTKFPVARAQAVAEVLRLALEDFCERIEIAGSIRRRKPEVGDVEIVFVPKMQTIPDGLFDTKEISQAGHVIDALVRAGALARRKNVNGSEMWGAKNKLALHVATGIPVDFFATTEAAWFNYLVCRTGGAENNTRLAMAAQDKGWKWNPYGPGFTDARGEIVPVKSERDVFELLGLDYLEPWER